MYVPPQFAEPRLEALHALVRAHPLGTLVAVTRSGIGAEHLPLLLSQSSQRLGLLQGHVARANPIWEALADGSDVLLIFQGPSHYVSPQWYPSKQEHGKVVPTWNYLVVHARGRIEWNFDRAWLRNHLESLTAAHEITEDPWSVSDAPATFIERMLDGIVGFEVPIDRIEGKWKLSQNKSASDRRGVISGLRQQTNASAREMLNWMSDAADDGEQDGG